jgi:hypothetical protein
MSILLFKESTIYYSSYENCTYTTFVDYVLLRYFVHTTESEFWLYNKMKGTSKIVVSTESYALPPKSILFYESLSMAVKE